MHTRDYFIKRERNLISAGHNTSYRPAQIHFLASALERGYMIPIFFKPIDNVAIEAELDRRSLSRTKARYKRKGRAKDRLRRDIRSEMNES